MRKFLLSIAGLAAIVVVLSVLGARPVTGNDVMTVIVFAIYFVPTIVAERRKHPAATAILLLNLFLGWTFIGWVVALVWSAKPVPVTETR